MHCTKTDFPKVHLLSFLFVAGIYGISLIQYRVDMSARLIQSAYLILGASGILFPLSIWLAKSSAQSWKQSLKALLFAYMSPCKNIGEMLLKLPRLLCFAMVFLILCTACLVKSGLFSSFSLHAIHHGAMLLFPFVWSVKILLEKCVPLFSNKRLFFENHERMRRNRYINA